MVHGAGNFLDDLGGRLQSDGSAAVVTLIEEDGSVLKMILDVDGRFSPDPPEGLQKPVLELVSDMRRSNLPAAVGSVRGAAGIEYQVVVEDLRPHLHLIVFGAGHVGQSVALIGSLVGYSVSVIDERAEFLTRDRFPYDSIELLHSSFESAAVYPGIDSNTAVVIVTRGHQFDEICLKKVIKSDAKYIGMIGSRRRVIAVFDRLRHAGFPENLLERVHAPIGLKIAARSPQEIAVAIIAEIIQVVNQPG